MASDLAILVFDQSQFVTKRNYTQDWYITTNWINHTIKINFATCFIENLKGACLFDYLYVYDGANASSPEMMKSCCGKTHSATLESSTGEMYILFETDNMLGDTGFEIEYWSNGITTTTTTTTVASSTALYSSSLIPLTATPLIQTFTSHPGYDGHTSYPDGNYTQDWYITTNWINHTIKINFATCFIENDHGVCLFDYLYVFDGANSSCPKMIKTCCGRVHSATLESSTGEMYIMFATDNTIGDTGFEIEYWSNGITTTTTTTTVAPSTALYSSSLISLTATPLIQTFTSHPGYDGHTPYPDGNYTQDWYITTNWINHTIKINIATCFMENAKGVCLFDLLYVFDGANASSPKMIQTCCGSFMYNTSATSESSTGEMYILFETDNTVGDSGFEIEYWSNGITTTTTTTVASSTGKLVNNQLQALSIVITCGPIY
ncbi:CUBN [Mytilus coruscus]|uniref:CUBN n=1 Tax=Mytilus coruscus TaxID=42192 RepID=A0A6J8CAT6_MYTCO|nr:CUBN [Mytilus coruscus]